MALFFFICGANLTEAVWLRGKQVAGLL